MPIKEAKAFEILWNVLLNFDKFLYKSSLYINSLTYFITKIIEKFLIAKKKNLTNQGKGDQKKK